jgi:hypothetical protein
MRKLNAHGTSWQPNALQNHSDRDVAAVRREYFRILAMRMLVAHVRRLPIQEPTMNNREAFFPLPACGGGKSAAKPL